MHQVVVVEVFLDVVIVQYLLHQVVEDQVLQMRHQPLLQVLQQVGQLIQVVVEVGLGLVLMVVAVQV